MMAHVNRPIIIRIVHHQKPIHPVQMIGSKVKARKYSLISDHLPNRVLFLFVLGLIYNTHKFIDEFVSDDHTDEKRHNSSRAILPSLCRMNRHRHHRTSWIQLILTIHLARVKNENFPLMRIYRAHHMLNVHSQYPKIRQCPNFIIHSLNQPTKMT